MVTTQVTEASVVEQLRKDLESEKENAESFIEELESMSTLEEEKLVLRQQLAEKKEAFAKVQSTFYTGRECVFLETPISLWGGNLRA